MAEVMEIGITKGRAGAAEALGVQINVPTLKGRRGAGAPPIPNRVETRIRASKASLPITPRRVPEPISIAKAFTVTIGISVTMFAVHIGILEIQESGFTASSGKS